MNSGNAADIKAARQEAALAELSACPGFFFGDIHPAGFCENRS